MPFFELETNLRIFYKVHGEGPTKIFFIMGLNQSHVSWLRQWEYFSQFPEIYTICVFDNRGIGESDCNKWFIPYSTKMLAQDCLKLLQYLQWDSDINLVGISLGGMISLELMYAKPHLFKSVTLISTTAGGTPPPLNGAVTILRMMMTVDISEKVKLAVPMLFHEEYLSRECPAKKYKTMREFIIDEYTERRKLVKAPSVFGMLGQISAALSHHVSKERLDFIRNTCNAKVMVMTGTWDNLVDPKNSHYLAANLQARLEIFENSGHCLIEDSSERFHKLLEEHISSPAISTSSS